MKQVAPNRMKYKQITNPWSSRFTIDYYNFNNTIHSLYEYNPFDDQSYVKRISYLEGRENLAHRQELVQILRSFHAPELLHPKVEYNLQRLSQSDSVVVIGGQQAGLMTGPMYTIHKAITIIQIAHNEEKKLGRPVIPVFWIAGEDHDLDEVDHVWIQDDRAQLVKHRLDYEDKGKYPISSLKIKPEQLHIWLAELSKLLPDSPYKQEWLKRCTSLITEPISWTRYFARLMHDLFGKWGLILIDSSDLALRKFEVSFFQKLLEKNQILSEKVAKAATQFEKLGYDVPVELSDQKAHLFIHADGERHLLYRDQDEWFTKEGQHRFSTEQIIKILHDSPEKFSNNVLTRPLMQEFLFPTLVFVGGGSEVAYWGLLKEAFLEMGLQMPIVFPRPSMTIVDRRVQKRMEQFQLTWSDLVSDLEKKKDEWLEHQTHVDFSAMFDDLKLKTEELYQPLIKILKKEVGMDLNQMAEKNKQKVWEQIDFLAQYTERQFTLKHQTVLRRWDELISTLSPRKRPQERVLNLLSFWNRHGLEWIDQVISDPFIHRENHLQLIIM
ncbi:bacillithiol biosynthesis cysteine-adding enzyme BshC [Thermoflavimicrobium daqui]|uniref:Putative cysteine ligase BshC n=1 Tax=Thermoflavimicrobium daqui TaxID=2137476 RepID=A0A364K6S2_9BACL|nr:bacillithiol biosynthesis cysteine-adding enzyme BshC [Thermoflavimicrobium daqui]RAL26005.1 bacillithiol biosynthesis cysteine-adding enzyme BshC [Thermoflavimicrobium daqui]